MSKDIVEKNDTIESLDDTMVFNLESPKNTKEMNVIKEKSLVVDFTEPVEVLSDSNNKKTKNKKTNKKNKKIKFKPLAKLVAWWSNLTKMKKIIFSVIAFLSLVLIALLILVLTKPKDQKNEKLPDVIVEAENYTYKNGVLIFNDENKNEVGKYTCKNKDEKKCYVAFRSNEDDFIGDLYLNQDGTKLETRSSIINGQYIFVVDNKNGSNEDIILYNISKKEKIGTYKLFKQSRNNASAVVLKDEDNKYGVLDLSEDKPKTLINFLYDYAGIVNTDMATKYIVLNKNNKYYVTDFEEKLVSTGFSDRIVDYNDNFVVVKTSDNFYKIYNYEGKELTPNNYLFIKIVNNYYAALLDNGIIVYDNSGLKYNETPIGLTSTNYNRTYVFDANKQLISNDVAFEIEVNEEYISITRGKANDLLSIKEAQDNKERPFVSYYNGILYFYAESQKQNLIGKYTCKNRNTVGALDHCTLANSSSISKNDLSYDIQNGIISILNNRFVFINDTVTTPQIYLYDLKVNKKLGPYQMVEIPGLVSGVFESKSTSSSYAIAKNSKDQYGLLNITDQSVNIVLNFEYPELEKSGDNFVAKKKTGSYVVISKDGNELCKEIPDKIMNYTGKYITAVTAKGTYKVYDYEGKEIAGSDDFTYVKLSDKYFVAIIKNHQLKVFEYQNPTQAINFGKDINIKSSDSWKTVNYFKVVNALDSYVVTITDGVNDATYTSVREEPKQEDSILENTDENNSESN